MASPKSSITITIPAGETISSSADLTIVQLLAVLGPPDWSPANVSFLVSADDLAANYRDLWGADGTEIVRSMGPNRCIVVDETLTAGAFFIKLRSGPRNNPVIQAADRVFKLIVQ
jgi:hypothetical protein